MERLLDFLGLPLFDPSGKYGFKDRKTLTDLLALQINKTPRKLCFEEQVITPQKKTKNFVVCGLLVFITYNSFLTPIDNPCGGKVSTRPFCTA